MVEFAGPGTLNKAGILGSAIFSECGTYRYTLHRHLSDAPGTVVWVLLNPSTATEDVQDPTVAKCCGYSVRAGFGHAVVTNLFALRSTDPKGLKLLAKAGKSPVGVDLENDRHIVNMAREADMVICGWGRHGDYQDRGRYVAALLLLNDLGHKLNYLKLLSDNTPGHPLYLRNDLIPQPWKEARDYAGIR